MASRPDMIPVDKVESHLCCSICLERLDDPRTLPCFHSYCKHCLETFVAKHRKKAAKAGLKIEEFECPSCRSLFGLKENEEVANIRGSHFIRNMVDVLNAQGETNVWKCSNHDEKAACCRCVTCEAFLCEECSKAHDNWPGFKKHSVLTIDELKKPENQSKIKGQMRCKEHADKKLKFYCETCQVLICRYCMDFSHVRPEHLCHPIEKVVGKHREALQGCCNTLDEKQAEGEKSLKDLVDAEKELEESAPKAKEEISKQKNDIIKAVEDVFQSKVNEVDQLHAAAKEQLAEQRNKVESFLEKVKSADSMSKNVLEKGSNEEVIESRKMVEERIEMVKEECQSAKDFQKPHYIGQSWFEANQVKTEIVSNLFGEVVSKDIIFPSSTIIQKGEYVQQLLRWFHKKDHEWKLCYRASRDGWTAKDFHSKCDKKTRTVTLVKVDDKIFGGFTDTDWGGKAGPKTSKSAFMFSLKNKDNLPPFKSTILKVESATFVHKDYVAMFGTGSTTSDFDLFITGDPLAGKCYSDLGNAYKLPDRYERGTNRARCLLAGSFNFKPSEIEVFHQVERKITVPAFGAVHH